MKNPQEWIARGEIPAQHGDGFAAMPDLLTVHQYGAVADVVTAPPEYGSEFMIAAAVTDHEVGHTPEQLAAKGKMPTERTTAVVNKSERHEAILTCSASFQPLLIQFSVPFL